MTNKTKELVAAGYALAKDLHCAESAALVRELATQLDVQLSRSNALAAENAGLKESEVPLGAIENGRAFADRLEAYPFECEGGNLNMCSDWQEFRRCFEHLSEWAMHSRSETPATDAFWLKCGLALFLKVTCLFRRKCTCRRKLWKEFASTAETATITLVNSLMARCLSGTSITAMARRCMVCTSQQPIIPRKDARQSASSPPSFAKECSHERNPVRS